MKLGAMREGENAPGVSVKPVSADEWQELKALRLEALCTRRADPLLSRQIG